MRVKFIIFVSLYFIVAHIQCSSVEKYNSHLASKVSVSDLQKDVNYVEYKLNKLHPSLDWYISKEALATKFDSLRTTITEPLTPNEFYFKISPVVASVKQGHMVVIPLVTKLEKKEIKKLNKSEKNPLAQLTFKYYNDELYLDKNYTKDSLLLPGSKIISVENITPQEMNLKYKNTYSSDGLNTSYLSHGFASKFTSYLLGEKQISDSIHFVLQYKDSIYERVLARTKPGKKVVDSLASKKDSIAPVKIVLTKAEKAKKKNDFKIERKKNRYFLYNSLSKDFTRSLSYIPSDSTIAVLKIKGFKHRQHKKAYDSIFNEIEQNKVKTLVLDLRNNGGGSLEEIHNLYSYLTPEPFVFIDTIKVTNRTGVATNRLRAIPLAGKIVLSPFILYTTVKGIVSVKKGKNNEYYLFNKQTKLTVPKANRFDGKLFVLINGGSFSASCVLSSNLKSNNRATFIGEETGGTYNGTVAGTMPLLTLPNSKLKVRVGLQKIAAMGKTEEFGRGIMPDVTIVETPEQIIDKSDPHIEWILANLKNIE
ncbi:S41 family peptidase [Flavobacterium ardleyense]|uniref:S41 family peptidase n=1 Tax=Flavobacterium ardleyense TaxID=2038737 RepID=A0ABW5Z3M1_9FLAO